MIVRVMHGFHNWNYFGALSKVPICLINSFMCTSDPIMNFFCCSLFLDEWLPMRIGSTRSLHLVVTCFTICVVSSYFHPLQKNSNTLRSTNNCHFCWFYFILTVLSIYKVTWWDCSYFTQKYILTLCLNGPE